MSRFRWVITSTAKLQSNSRTLAAANDFARLRELCPLLETVGFNGQTSGKFAPQFAAAGYRTVVLPSTSPAYASVSLEQKLVSWRALCQPSATTTRTVVSR